MGFYFYELYELFFKDFQTNLTIPTRNNFFNMGFDLVLKKFISD
jgi:hypothetical protein